MTETLHCPGVEMKVWGKITPIVDQGTVDVELVEGASGTVAICPMVANGDCRRAQFLNPNAGGFMPPICALEITGRNLYSALKEVALTVLPDINKLNAITDVKAPVAQQARHTATVEEPIIATTHDVYEAPTQIINKKEIKPAKIKSETTEIQTDASFFPFLEAREFLSGEKKIAKAYSDGVGEENLPILLKNGFNFSGAKGIIEIVPDLPDGDFESYYVDAEMPLGPVRWIAESENGGTSYVELPVKIRVSFETRKFKQYLALQQHVLKLEIGGEEYYLSCSKGENDYEYTIDDFRNLGRGDTMTFFDDVLTDSRGNEINIAFPMDLDKLKTIQVTFVYNPGYDEEDLQDES